MVATTSGSQARSRRSASGAMSCDPAVTPTTYAPGATKPRRSHDGPATVPTTPAAVPSVMPTTATGGAR